MNDYAEIEQQCRAEARRGWEGRGYNEPVLGCDELGEYYASDDPLNDPVNREIFEEEMDRRLADRDMADRSLMDAAAGMWYSPARPGLYELHARLDDGHLNAARQLIADVEADAQFEAEPG